MWIEKLKNGKYAYRERYIDPYTEKSIKISVIKSSKSNQAKKQAQMELNEKIEAALAVKQLAKITFKTLQDEWWVIHQTKVRKSSIATYKTTLKYINTLNNSYF